VEAEAVRLDKWLWAARFFKTRSLAAQAIAGGKIQVNGERAKRSKLLQLGDEIRVRQGPFEHHILVRGLSENRGPSAVAHELYQETAASVRAREVIASQLRMARVPRFEGKGRPTKRDRRDMERLRGLDD
jgi:ribosome-associated heat shock protein Hsp15